MAHIGIAEVGEVLVLVVARCVAEGCEVDILNDNAGLGVVLAVEEVAGVLAVEGTAVESEVVAVGVKDGVEDGGVVLYPCSRGPHDDEVGIDAAVEDVGPTGVWSEVTLTELVGEA